MQFSSSWVLFLSLNFISSLSSFAIGMSNYFRFFQASLASKNENEKKNLIYDNQVDYMQISVLWLFSSSLKSFCCLLCELLSKYLNGSGLIAKDGLESEGAGVREIARRAKTREIMEFFSEKNLRSCFWTEAL